MHYETTADFADKLKVRVKTGCARATATDATAAVREKFFKNRKGGELDVGFLRIGVFKLRPPLANVNEWLLAASLILGDEFLAENWASARSDELRAIKATHIRASQIRELLY